VKVDTFDFANRWQVVLLDKKNMPKNGYFLDLGEAKENEGRILVYRIEGGKLLFERRAFWRDAFVEAQTGNDIVLDISWMSGNDVHHHIELTVMKGVEYTNLHISRRLVQAIVDGSLHKDFAPGCTCADFQCSLEQSVSEREAEIAELELRGIYTAEYNWWLNDTGLRTC